MINLRTTLLHLKPRPGGNGDISGFRVFLKTTFRQFTRYYSTTTGRGLVDHPDYVGSKDGSCRDYPVSFSVLGFKLRRKFPSQVGGIAADDPRRYEGRGWRVDTRGPEEMMKAGGFFGAGTDDDIRNHVYDGIGAHLGSRLCSWSISPQGTQLVSRTFKHAMPDVALFRYEAKLFRHNTFDTRRDTPLRAIRTMQDEVVCPRVRLRDITAVTLPATADSGAKKIFYPFWPHSKLSITQIVVRPDPLLPDSSIF